MTRGATSDSFLQGYVVCAAAEGWQHRAAAALRQQVFVQEQGLFTTHDRDTIDDVALPLVAIALDAPGGPLVVGTVRLHEVSPGVWWGSRLAVAHDWHRVGKLGSELIRLAVGTAHARGARQFHAHVQMQNVALFQRLHWTKTAEVTLHGHPHAHMLADLAPYPPVPDPATGWPLRAPGPVATSP